jgi:alpha-tubulin suppressor-like RCC1 family protein
VGVRQITVGLLVLAAAICLQSSTSEAQLSPSISIVGQSGSTASRSATFVFSTRLPLSQIASTTCLLDGQPAFCRWNASVQPPSAGSIGLAHFAGLSEGQHTFSVSISVKHVQAPTSASRSWTVDFTPPTILTPADLEVPATNGKEVRVTYSTPVASDNLDPSPEVHCWPRSGSLFPIGTTTVKCVAIDAAGNHGDASFNVLVYRAVTIPAGGAATITGSGSLQGISLRVPADAFPHGATVGLSPVANPDTSAPAGSVGPTFQILSDVEPTAPVELRVPYNPGANASADGVNLAWWGDSAGEWLPVATTFDSATGQLVATIRHFSTWTTWLLEQVAGSTGTPPTCDQPLPSWVPRVFATATDGLSLAYSCAGGAGGSLQVRVTSNRDGWVYASFDQKPDSIRYIDGPVTFTGSSLPNGGVFGSTGDWRIYVPPNVVAEADFSEPPATLSTPVETAIHGFAARDGVSYVGDAISKALSLVWSKETSGVLAPAFAKCAADFIDPTSLTLLPTINYDTVAQCFIDQIEAALKESIADGGFDQVSAGTVASKLGALKKASFWLEVADVSRDLLDVHLDSHSKPAVITAVENTIVTIYPEAVSLSTDRGAPGSSFAVSGAHFPVSETVVIDFDSTPVAMTTTDSEGSFAGVEVSVPETASVGNHIVTAMTSGGSTGAEADFAVSAGAFGVTMGSIGVGEESACAVTSSGALECWGDNTYGELGTGIPGNSATPIPVPGLSSGVAAISHGYESACSLTVQGAAECWGNGAIGEVGTGTLGSSPTPQPVTGLSSSVTAISHGYESACALIAGGSVECWGDNRYGELGSDSPGGSPTPVPVTGLSSAAAVSVGDEVACALTSGGAVECWGDNRYGELGDDYSTPLSYSSTPVPVTGLTDGAAAVSVGNQFACALTTAGGVKCWGANYYGVLGNGTNADSSHPVPVTGLSSGVTAISSGEESACALTLAGAVECWGDNTYGELGNGTTSASNVPVPVMGLSSGVAAISVGAESACALTFAGVAECWGDNTYGELGNGTTTSSATPVPVAAP